MKILNISFSFLLFMALVTACNTVQKPTDQAPMHLSLEQANKLAELPLACVNQHYPTKYSHVLNNPSDLKPTNELYPAFCGCFDWHSAVHGHWSLVKLLKDFPDLEKAAQVEAALRNNLTTEKISGEVAYFADPAHKTFERTYGWAWLLKLAEELHTWDSPLARELENNLQPLTDVIVQRYLDFLPKLHYPMRVGEHPNTAFGLSFAWDYALACQQNELKDLIQHKAHEFYANDQACPINWEPGGSDFLSPCLEEVDLMRKVLDEDAFDEWLQKFMPALQEPDFQLDVALVSDRTDGKLVHLDGLNFSRAWVLYGLAKQYAGYNYLIPLANAHMQQSLPNLMADSYMGSHWLGTFAIYALADNVITNE